MPDIQIVTTNTAYVAPDLRDIPFVVGGDIRIASQYTRTYNPYQDTILLMGHADPVDGIFEPKETTNNPLEIINMLGANPRSPLLRAYLELIDLGCENVIVYPIAPMSEYVSEVNLSARFEINSEWVDEEVPVESNFPSIQSVTLDWSDNNFYERYYNRLHVAYSNLEAWGLLDGVGIIVPVEAVFYDSGDVDFMGQLIDFCHTYFNSNGNVVLGVLGTRIAQVSDQAVDEMINDPRLNPNTSLYLEYGKYVMVAVGEGIITHKSTSLTHNSSLAVQVAASMALNDLKRGLSGTRLNGCVGLTGRELTKDQQSRLAKARLNPVGRTARGSRGFAYEIKLLSDNTLSGLPEETFNLSYQGIGTNYWSMSIMRMVAAVINQIKQDGQTLLGESLSAADTFKKSVETLLVRMRDNDYIRDFSLNIETIPNEYKLLVKIGLAPIFTIKHIYFQVEAGPG